MATVLRPPIIVKVYYKNRSSWSRTEVWQSPNLTVLYGQDVMYGAPGQVPDYHWPNPKVTPRAIELYTWINSVRLLLLRPFNQEDWPNPKLASRANASWSNGIPLPLVPVGTPFTNFNWTNPKQTFRVNDWVSGIPFPLIQPEEGEKPFSQVDWPNPKVMTARLDWISETPIWLIPVEGTPVINPDWSNPRQPVRKPDFTAGTPLSIIQQLSTPFSQTDWPNPKLGPRRQSWENSLALNLIDHEPPPGAHYFPAITKPQAQGLTWINALNPNLVVVEAPFTNFDWANPKVARRVNPGWISFMGRWMQPADAGPPKTCFDYPNPKLPPLKMSNYTSFSPGDKTPPTPPSTTHEWLIMNRRHGRR